jgi:hypothetical protein
MTAPSRNCEKNYNYLLYIILFWPNNLKIRRAIYSPFAFNLFILLSILDSLEFCRTGRPGNPTHPSSTSTTLLVRNDVIMLHPPHPPLNLCFIPINTDIIHSQRHLAVMTIVHRILDLTYTYTQTHTHFPSLSRSLFKLQQILCRKKVHKTAMNFECQKKC